MNERTVLEQRITTLSGLLDTPGGPLGPNAGDLGDQLRGGWETERRLLERVLADTQGNDVSGTIGAWRDRTQAFVARSGPGTPSWTDREGRTWRADEVLALLDETQDRIDRWVRTADDVGDTRPAS